MRYEIAWRLVKYLNYVLENEEELPFKQNVLEQIYIAKDDNDWKCFYNARPITKTSPIYKLLDTILNNRLKEDLNETGHFKLNNKQVGFRAGLGCELNLLRIVETIRGKIAKRGNKKL